MTSTPGIRAPVSSETVPEILPRVTWVQPTLETNIMTNARIIPFFN
jgi:hypothetical protein